MDKIKTKLENLDKLHKTKREYLIGLICQCLAFTMLVTSYVLSIITKDVVVLSIVAVFLGIIIFCLFNNITMLCAVRKQIIEETDNVCEMMAEESHKMMAQIFEQIDKEIKEKRMMAQKKAEENKAEADKKAETEKKAPTKKVNTTKSVQKKADPKKVEKKETKK